MTNLFKCAIIGLVLEVSMLLSLNFKNLSVEGYAAFVLAIIFTILAIASAIIFARHKNLNVFLLVVFTLVIPFIAVFCWVYLLLDVLQYSALLNLGISAGAAVGYVVLALALAALLTWIFKSHSKKAAPVEEVAPKLIEHKEEPVEEAVVEETVIEEPVVEETVVEEPVETVEEEEEAEEGVVFSNEPRKTFSEQLETVNYETRKAYEEILEYAKSQPGTKAKGAKFHFTVSIGRMKLVQFKFVRGALISSFMAGSSELKNYSAAEKAVKIKEKPVLIEVTGAESVDVAKNMVDIVYKNIKDAKFELKESKKAAKRAKKEAEENAQAEETQTAEPQTVETPVEQPKKKRGRKKKSETTEQPVDQTEGE